MLPACRGGVILPAVRPGPAADLPDFFFSARTQTVAKFRRLVLGTPQTSAFERRLEGIRVALRRLTTGEMAQLSGPWTTEGSAARKAILAIPELAPLLPKIDAAHRALHDTQPGQENPRLAKLQEEESGLDLRHDEVIRGSYWFLTALAWLSGAGQSADNLLRLRDFLFPEGLDATQRSYREEAGAVELLKTRIAGDPAVKKALKDIPVHKGTLWQSVEELFRLGGKLGALENERAELQPAPGPGDAARVMAARNQWIRAVNALVANADLADLDAEKVKLIFGPLRHAEKAADRRKGTSAEAPEEAAPPADTPPNK